MRHLLSLLLLTMLCLQSSAGPKQDPTLYAHRGCWSKSAGDEFIIPENSLPAVAMARRMGYTGIECDVHYTKDSVMVILHDATLNRTARRASDYSKLDKPVKLADLTFEELRRDYVLESTNPEWRTPIPTLEELLIECKKHDIVPMLHSALMPSYHVAQQMFGNEWVCFTGGVEHMQRVREFSDCIILLAINDGSAEENIARLEQIGGRCGISTMKYELYTEEFCHALTSRGYIVQASIFPAPHEAIAQRNGITYQLTDFSALPTHKPIYTTTGAIAATSQPAQFRWRGEKPLECGAMTIELDYEGRIEVVINNRKYTLESESKCRDIIGNRVFDTTPEIEITALRGAKVKRAKIRIYEY